MIKIILDTNFILTTTKQKIYLFEDLKDLFGVYKLLIPKQVIDELKKIQTDKESKVVDREFASLAQQILTKHAPEGVPTKEGKTQSVDLETPNVDAGIIRYITKNPETITATLDRGLKDKIERKNKSAKFLTIKEKKRILLQ